MDLALGLASGLLYIDHAGRRERKERDPKAPLSLLMSIAVKPVPVLLMARRVRLEARPSPAIDRFAVGLYLCALGDALLDLNFVAGLSSFLTGHVAYIAAFYALESRARWDRALLPLGFAVGMLTYLWSSLGNLKLAVAAYVFTISTMMWRSAALPIARTSWARQALLGAMLFAGSDSLIALDKFVSPVSGARKWILSSYWGAQLLLTRAFLLQSQG